MAGLAHARPTRWARDRDDTRMRTKIKPLKLRMLDEHEIRAAVAPDGVNGSSPTRTCLRLRLALTLQDSVSFRRGVSLAALIWPRCEMPAPARLPASKASRSNSEALV